MLEINVRNNEQKNVFFNLIINPFYNMLIDKISRNKRMNMNNNQQPKPTFINLTLSEQTSSNGKHLSLVYELKPTHLLQTGFTILRDEDSKENYKNFLAWSGLGGTLTINSDSNINLDKVVDSIINLSEDISNTIFKSRTKIKKDNQENHLGIYDLNYFIGYFFRGQFVKDNVTFSKDSICIMIKNLNSEELMLFTTKISNYLLNQTILVNDLNDHEFYLITQT